MALRDNIKNFAKNVVRRFTWGDEEKETLNEQVDNWTINTQPTQQKTQASSWTSWALINSNLWNIDLTSSDDNYSISNSLLRGDEREQGFITTEWSDLVSWDLIAAASEDKNDVSKRLWDIADAVRNAPRTVSNFVNLQLAEQETEKQEDRLALWYNKKNWNIYYLDLWWRNKEWAEWVFNTAQNKYYNTLANPWLTEEQKLQALKNFYDETNWLFSLKSDDYYSDWGFLTFDWLKLKRRKNQYSQEQLDTLAANTENFWIKKWNYTPSFEEWVERLDVQNRNNQSKTSIYEWYWLTSDEDNEVRLSSKAQWEWFWAAERAELNWVNDILKQYVSDWDKRQRIMSNIMYAFSDQNNRIYTIVAPIYAAEQVILAKSPEKRTEWELKLLDTANKFRRMEKAMAAWLNDWAIQQIKYWMTNGDITESLTNFEWDRSLWEVLSAEVKKLSWQDWNSYHSNIDVFQQMANDALFNYNRWSTWWSLWERLQHWMSKVWYSLAEGWQQTAKVIWKVNSYIWYAPQPWKFLDKLSWDEWFAPTTAYLDQDFTAGRMIETDDSNIKRTAKKYLLQWAEYIPEIAGNLVPDVAVTIATSWVWAVWLARHVPTAVRAAKAVKWVKSLSTLNKIKTVVRASKWASTWIEALDKVAQATKAVNWTWGTMWKLIDRAITQSVIDQAMDGQWSWFDTEAYSNMSFALSSLGTLWFNLIPDLARGQLWGFLRKQINKNAITWTIWDIADYMSSSTEATNNIVNVLRKNAPDIWVDELRQFARNFSDISETAKTAYMNLPQVWKDAANKWTKEIMYNQINQIFWVNSETARAARRILNNGSTNAADLIKYIWKLPWDVSIWPYTSTIKFKQWTQAYAKLWENADLLNSIDWWFASKLSDGFSQTDIENISNLKGFWDITRMQDEYFYDVWWKKFLTPEWANRLWIETTSLQSLWVELSQAENVREIFKERMKEIVNKDKAITDATIDAIVDSWWYDDVLEKVKTIMWC